MPLKSLQKRIVSTIAYFDMFDYPLTAVEIWKWLYRDDSSSQNQNCSLADILFGLQSVDLEPIIDVKDGFYFLLGRREIILTRLNRYCLAKTKFNIALKVTVWLRSLAFVQLVCVCNNVSYSNGAKKSDIDFFIVTSRGRLWLTRLMVTLVVNLLRRRRHGQKTANRVCLSFYTSEDYLNMSGIGLKPADPYLAYWLATLIPLYNRHETYPKLLSANGWLKDYLPNFYSNVLSDRRQVKEDRWLNYFRGLDEMILAGFLGGWLEKFSKRLQIKRIRRYAGALVDLPTTEVVISDEILKLHTTDRRQYYRQLWLDKLNQLIS